MLQNYSQLQRLEDEFEDSFRADKVLLPLLKTFIGRGEVKGHRFTQIEFQNKTYIYEVYDTSGNKRYEVFKEVVDGRFGKISYPKSKAFGLTAWTFPTLELSKKRFSYLISNHNVGA